LLWLLAGGVGPRIDKPGNSYVVPENCRYAVLFDPAYVRELVATSSTRDKVELVYIVTDSTAVFQQAVAELPAHVEPVRLYEAYLRNFEINSGDDQ
jgi:adenine-specific DNA-methyltransferase